MMNRRSDYYLDQYLLTGLNTLAFGLSFDLDVSFPSLPSFFVSFVSVDFSFSFSSLSFSFFSFVDDSVDLFSFSFVVVVLLLLVLVVIVVDVRLFFLGVVAEEEEPSFEPSLPDISSDKFPDSPGVFTIL